MKKKLLSFVWLLCSLVMLFVCMVLVLNKSDVSAETVSFEINTSVNPSDDFQVNQQTSNMISDHFWSKLPYTGKYKPEQSSASYMVNRIAANGFPNYFGGMYLNVDGRLIVNIKEEYMTEDYRESEWYQELVGMMESDAFFCRPVTYSYSELVIAFSDISMGPLNAEIQTLDVEFGAGLDTYKNRIVVDFYSQEDYDVVCSKLDLDIYSLTVVNYKVQET